MGLYFLLREGKGVLRFYSWSVLELESKLSVFLVYFIVFLYGDWLELLKWVVWEGSDFFIFGVFEKTGILLKFFCNCGIWDLV